MNKEFLTVQLASPEDALALGLPTGQQSIRLALSPADVSSIEEIDTYLPGYKPFGGFRADEVSPPMLKDKSVGKYRIYGLTNMHRRVHTEMSLQSPVGEVDPETSLTEYSMLPYGLGSFIPWQTENESGFDVKRAAAARVADILAVDREHRVWTLLRTLGSWGTNQRVTLGPGYQWNGGVNSDPIADIQARIRESSQPITGINLSLATSHALLSHPKVRDWMKAWMGDGALNPSILAGAGTQGAEFINFSLPAMPPFHVVGGKELNESTGMLEEYLGGDVVLVSNPPGDPTNFERIQTVRTFRLRGPSGTGWTSREFRIENRGLEGGTMVVAGYHESTKMVAPTAGGLIKGALQ